MLRVTLLGKPGCHLCEAAERELDRLRGRYPHSLEVVDITCEPRLLDEYGERIPVVQVSGHEYSAPLPREALERALRQALQESPS